MQAIWEWRGWGSKLETTSLDRNSEFKGPQSTLDSSQNSEPPSMATATGKQHLTHCIMFRSLILIQLQLHLFLHFLVNRSVKKLLDQHNYLLMMTFSLLLLVGLHFSLKKETPLLFFVLLISEPKLDSYGWVLGQDGVRMWVLRAGRDSYWQKQLHWYPIPFLTLIHLPESTWTIVSKTGGANLRNCKGLPFAKGINVPFFGEVFRTAPLTGCCVRSISTAALAIGN